MPPLRCRQCHGVWLPHESIREGLVPASAHVDDKPSEIAEDADARVGFCPAGHGFLRRARVDVAPHPFHLDRCSACAGVWFDAGEWASVAASEWLRHLDDLWDPNYQKRVREEATRKHAVEALKEALGDIAFEQVVETAAILRNHPMKSFALAYPLEETRVHAPDA